MKQKIYFDYNVYERLIKIEDRSHLMKFNEDLKKTIIFTTVVLI